MGVTNIRTPEVDQLLQAILSFDNTDDLFGFMVDLCTIRELNEMSQRFEVARLLAAGEPYAVVHEATGASSTTVARVSKALNHGEGGYMLSLAKMAPKRDPKTITKGALKKNQ